MCSKFSLPPNNLFRYFQIRQRIKSLFPAFGSVPMNQLWEEFLSSDFHQNSFLSSVYNKLLASDRSTWEKELGTVFSNEWWEISITKIHTRSISAHFHAHTV